jgi:transcriptional regulator with XRE-family HTH domain
MAAGKLNPEHLRREMMLRGWNGIDLAYRSGVSPATVSHAVQGLPVSTSTIRKLALALSKAPRIPGAEELLA